MEEVFPFVVHLLPCCRWQWKGLRVSVCFIVSNAAANRLSHVGLRHSGCSDIGVRVATTGFANRASPLTVSACTIVEPARAIGSEQADQTDVNTCLLRSAHIHIFFCSYQESINPAPCTNSCSPVIISKAWLWPFAQSSCICPSFWVALAALLKVWLVYNASYVRALKVCSHMYCLVTWQPVKS